jgi:hypothetical protein
MIYLSLTSDEQYHMSTILALGGGAGGEEEHVYKEYIM